MKVDPRIFGIHVGDTGTLAKHIRTILHACEASTLPEEDESWGVVAEFAGKLERAHEKAKQDGVL
jgi:hypothetical protein